MEAVCERGNLMLAYQRVVENKGAAGVDGIGVPSSKTTSSSTGRRSRPSCWRVAIMPQPVRKVEIPKPQGGVRTLGIPTLTGPTDPAGVTIRYCNRSSRPEFSASSYGFRPGRNAHQAVQGGARAMLPKAAGWVVDMDLEKFFDRVNHDLLMERLSKQDEDGRVLKLIRRYLEAGMMAEGISLPEDGRHAARRAAVVRCCRTSC